jgi:tRNA (cytidine/uridine-2'-O-)-methyltransferase
MRISVYQPDIPQNLATLIRLSACLNVAIDIIEPCGFPFSEKKFKRTVMDYSKYADLKTFIDFEFYKRDVKEFSPQSRVILLTTKSKNNYFDFRFKKNDRLLLGRESEGVPDQVRKWVDHDLKIMMPGQGRSLNIVISCAMVLSEALRQIRHL